MYQKYIVTVPVVSHTHTHIHYELYATTYNTCIEALNKKKKRNSDRKILTMKNYANRIFVVESLCNIFFDSIKIRLK